MPTMKENVWYKTKLVSVYDPEIRRWNVSVYHNGTIYPINNHTERILERDDEVMFFLEKFEFLDVEEIFAHVYDIPQVTHTQFDFYYENNYIRGWSQEQ